MYPPPRKEGEVRALPHLQDDDEFRWHADRGEWSA